MAPSTPPRRTSATGPHSSVRRSPTSRPLVIANENAANASAATPGAGPERLLHVDRAPVARRALGDETAQREGAQRPQGARRPDEQRPVVLGRDCRRPPAAATRLIGSATASPRAPPTARWTPTSTPQRPRRCRRSWRRTGRPSDHAAWNEERIGHGWRRSTSTPWAFIATSSEPVEAPRLNVASTSSGRLGARPGSAIATQNHTSVTRVVTRLPRGPTASRRSASRRASRRRRRQREAERAVRELEVGLDRRDADGPAADQRAVEREDERDRAARGARAGGQGGALLAPRHGGGSRAHRSESTSWALTTSRPSEAYGAVTSEGRRSRARRSRRSARPATARRSRACRRR